MKLKDVQVVPSCGFGDNENIWRTAQGMKDSESKKMVVKVQLPMSATGGSVDMRANRLDSSNTSSMKVPLFPFLFSSLLASVGFTAPFHTRI